jgi:hypothetical protein
MTKEEAAVVAQQREEREKQQMIFAGGGATLLGLGGVVFWCLNSANKLSGRQPRDLRRRHDLDDGFLPPSSK